MAIIISKDDLCAISPDTIYEYLVKNGFSVVDVESSCVFMSHYIEKALVIMVPTRNTFADYATRIYCIIEDIANIRRTSVFDVYKEISGENEEIKKLFELFDALDIKDTEKNKEISKKIKDIKRNMYDGV